MIALYMQGGRPEVLLQECRNGVSLGITDGKILISRWGRARDTRPPCTRTSILPIFFMVLLLCFTECFTCRLPDGGSQLPVGEPAGYPLGYQYRETKKSPDSRGYCQGVWRVASVGYCIGLPRRAYNPIVLSRFASVKTYGKYIFFLLFSSTLAKSIDKILNRPP